MKNWEKLLNVKEKEEKSNDIEYPLFVRLLLFILFLGISGILFYLFIFDKSPQYYIMKYISNCVS
jgi:hypothetical protein